MGIINIIRYKFFSPLILFFIIVGLALTQIAQANAAACQDEWHYLIAPYFWMASLNGDISVKNRTAHISIPFSKILQHLKMGAEAHMEAIYGRWSLMLDPTYLKISADTNRRLINPTLTSETLLVDTGVYYQLLSTEPSSDHFASLELFGGGRYLGVNNKLQFPLPDVTVSANTSLFAPLLGARIKYDPNQKTSLWIQGNVGGFDVDNVRNTWEAGAGIAYNIHHNIDLSLAYRVLGIDFNKSRAAANVTMNGPIVGLVFAF